MIHLRFGILLAVSMVFAFGDSSGQAIAQRFQFRQQRSNYYPQQTQTQSFRQGTGQVISTSTDTSMYWANQFEFGPRHHDFGAVPTASKQEYVFEFKNTLDQAIQLLNVRASCGCTKPKILTPVVPPGETAKVLAKYDTLAFRGAKQATVTLLLQKNKPYTQSTEIQFSVKGKIRQDVVMTPGLVKFENVPPGQTQTRTVQVKYAGSPRWQLMDVKSSNPNIKIETKDISANRNSGRIDYQLTITLEGQQDVGMFAEEIKLVTNDVNGSNMKLAVEGRVKPIVESSPINLGSIGQGRKIKKRLILRGSEAFEIKEILVDDQRIRFESPKGKKSLHILSYQLDTTSIGDIATEIKVITSAKGQPETLIPFRARIHSNTTVAGN